MLGISARFGVCVRDITAANDDNLQIVADQTLQIQRMTTLRVGSSECSVTSHLSLGCGVGAVVAGS